MQRYGWQARNSRAKAAEPLSINTEQSTPNNNQSQLSSTINTVQKPNTNSSSVNSSLRQNSQS